MLKTPAFLVVAGLIVAGAVVNGAATQRWSVFEPDPAIAERLHALEVKFEDWRAEEIPTDMPVNEQSTATSRRYMPPTAGRYGMVTLISGIPGSVSAHTPDVCYPGSGYATLRATKHDTVELPGGRAAAVYVADFEKKTATKLDRVRVRWAFAVDGDWIAPDHPRWQFATQLMRVPVLYKVYVVTPLTDDGEDDATTRAFVTAAFTQYASALGSKKRQRARRLPAEESSPRAEGPRLPDRPTKGLA